MNIIEYDNSQLVNPDSKSRKNYRVRIKILLVKIQFKNFINKKSTIHNINLNEVLLRAENHKIQSGSNRTIFENRPDYRILIHGKVLKESLSRRI